MNYLCSLLIYNFASGIDMTKILIIAGEPSGDNLGADLIKEMVFQNSLNHSRIAQEEYQDSALNREELIFHGIGGPLMEHQGLVSLFRMKELSVMGLTDVLFRLPKIFSIMRRIVHYVEIWKPDLVITIDSPDFSIRLVKRLRMVDKFVPVIQYVAPSVWAWRPSRAKDMAKHYDTVLTLLPFESKFFEKFGLNCEFVGHPVARYRLPDQTEVHRIISQSNIDTSKRLITILPGSRKSEIKYMLPIFLPVIRKLTARFEDLEFVIPAPLDLSKLIKDNIRNEKIAVKVISEENFVSNEFQLFKFSLFGLSDLALATSGSVSLELARAGTPMVTAYRCSLMFEYVLKRFVKLKSANLINIVLEENMVPEFLFERCNVNNLFSSMSELLNCQSSLIAQKDSYVKVIDMLQGKQGRSSETAARYALSSLS